MPTRNALLALSLLALPAATFASVPEKPNFIVLFADDQGWGDLGVQGHPDIRTPHIDRMAAEGMRFTSFYAAPFCGPSRAALMTGSYPPRLSLAFNHGPKASTGLHPDEVTVAELLQQRGYATRMIGKWHLGDAPEFLPHRHGFDSWFGIPFSNDMWRYHPVMPVREPEDERMTSARERAAMTGFAGQGSYYDLAKGQGFPHPLPLMRDDEVIETDPDQRQLTARYTDLALEFIEENRDRPFFLYLPYAMPHVPLFVSNERWGKSLRGRYGDVIEELDWSVGQILAKLRSTGLDRKTMVVYTSDNGPWLEYGIDAGSAGPFKLGKGTTWEGGMRVPGIFWMPGSIPAGRVSSAVAANMDLLPTFAGLAGAESPSDRTLDGRDLWPLLSGESEESPHEYFFFFAGSPRMLRHDCKRCARVGTNCAWGPPVGEVCRPWLSMTCWRTRVSGSTFATGIRASCKRWPRPGRPLSSRCQPTGALLAVVDPRRSDGSRAIRQAALARLALNGSHAELRCGGSLPAIAGPQVRLGAFESALECPEPTGPIVLSLLRGSGVPEP